MRYIIKEISPDGLLINITDIVVDTYKEAHELMELIDQKMKEKK